MKKSVLFECRNVEGVKKAWEHWGYQVYEPEKELNNLPSMEIGEILIVYKEKYEVESVFSFDFFPNLAEACHCVGMKYISWVLDCPHISLWSYAAEYPGNSIFVFDYKQYQMLMELGKRNIYYLPLCTDVEGFENIIRQKCEIGYEKYSHDVVFVGNLYNDYKHSLYDRINGLPLYLKGYLEALMEVQRKFWGVDLLEEIINENICNQFKKYVIFDIKDKYVDGAYEIMFRNLLGQKITQLERMEVCSYLARYFDFALYTGSDTSYDLEINNCGHADYVREMPLIFHCSKVNIHITLRSITSGMSLRVLDVLACEGFLLTNYQPEIAEYFVDGEELVMYHSFQDMYEKIEYYLEHEEERQRIAHAGYLKVKEHFNYIRGIGEIVKILEGK